MLTSPPCDAKNARSARMNDEPFRRPRDQRERVAMIVLDGEQPTRLQRARQFANVRVRVRQEEKNPARENQIVGGSF